MQVVLEKKSGNCLTALGGPGGRSNHYIIQGLGSGGLRSQVR